MVPIDATLMGLRPAATPSGDGSLRPRVRSGYALKRLGADEGEERFVLRDLQGGTFLRMEAEEAALFELLDGKRTVTELLGESEQLLGAAGPGRLAHLLAELADRGLLDGVGAAPVVPAARERLCPDLQAAREDRRVGRRLLPAGLSPLGPRVLLAADRDVHESCSRWPGSAASLTSSARGSAPRSSSPTAC